MPIVFCPLRSVMATNVPSSRRSLARQSLELPYPNRDAPWPSDPYGGVLQDSRDNAPFTSVTIPVPKKIQTLISITKSITDELDRTERHYLGSIITAVWVEMAFLKLIGQPIKDVLSTVSFTVLFGFAFTVWSKLKRVQHQLDALQHSIKSLGLPVEPPMPVITNDPTFPREEYTLKPIERPAVNSEPEGPDEPLVTVDKPPYTTYEHPIIPEPDNSSVVAANCPSPELPTPPGSYHSLGVTFEGMDNIIGGSDFDTDPLNVRVVIKNPSPAPTAPSQPDHGAGVTLEGMDNIVGVSEGTESSSAERSAALLEPASSHWLPVLREIKQHIEQHAEGRFERTSHLDQNEPPNRAQLRRCGVRLLMSSASLSPADFASPVGFLGPLETTPYYPTGDLQIDRAVAFTTAMDCLDHMEDHLHGNDDVRIATTLFELAQALSDLGLHKYALDTSGFALDTLEHPFVATPNEFHHHVASILSLRANILCDLKQNDEAMDAANGAVTHYTEFQGSQTTAVPELTFALLNTAVLLSSIGPKDKSAEVALQLIVLISEADEDMKEVSALCNLCLSNVRFDAEDGTDLSMTEAAIELTRTSSGIISQTALAGALLNKSKILSSSGQTEAAIPFSAEAVTLLRDMSATHLVFSLFLAHALDNHAHHLSEANHKTESYSIRQDAVELWQTLKVSAPNAIARSLAWSLFELAKFRCKGGDRKVLRGELEIAQHTVEVFREVVPLDVPGLADALYLFADRMLELDNNRDAATYAEESAQYFREAYEKDRKYALDLIFSLSLASSCLACTERCEDALHYAKQAVEVQHERNGVEDKTYNAHLCWLLMQVLYRFTEMNRQDEGIPFFQELQALEPSGEKHLARRSGTSQDNADVYKKQTSFWLDQNNDTPRPNNSLTSPVAVASSSTVNDDKGKGKEVVVPSEAPNTTAQDLKGKAKEVSPQVNLSSLGRSLVDEEIFSPGAVAQRGRADTGPRLEGIIGGGAGGLSSLLGMGSGRDLGGRTLGDLETSSGLGMGGLGIGGGGTGNLGSSGRLGGGRSLGDMGGMGELGGGINGLTESLFGRLSPDFFKLGNGFGTGGNTNNDKTDNGNGGGGAGSQSSSTTRTGTWSGNGIQSRLSDEGT